MLRKILSTNFKLLEVLSLPLEGILLLLQLLLLRVDVLFLLLMTFLLQLKLLLYVSNVVVPTLKQPILLIEPKVQTLRHAQRRINNKHFANKRVFLLVLNHV